MFKQSSSRNQRTKGFKVKHALQMFVLVAICIWLLYQVKHSHDKKRELEERNMKISAVVEDGHPDALRFGRKDLPQVSVERNNDAQTNNDDEENEEVEEAEVETKIDEVDEEDGKGVGEDEIDENDHEGGDEERDRNEESGEEEEKEEKEEKEEQSDEHGKPSDKEHENAEEKNQEAREENYRGDDASSAVVRDNETVESEARNSNDNGEKIENTKTDVDVNNKTVGAVYGLSVDESGIPSAANGSHLSNDTIMNMSPFVDGHHEPQTQVNATLLDYDNQVEQHANTTEEPLMASIETENNPTNIDGPSLLNSTISMSATQDQNSTETVIKTEEVSESTNDDSLKSEKNLIEQVVNHTTTDGTEKLVQSPTTSSIVNESGNASEVESAVKTDSNDPLAKVDKVPEEEKYSRTDLSTLPETESNGSVEEVAQE